MVSIGQVSVSGAFPPSLSFVSRPFSSRGFHVTSRDIEIRTLPAFVRRRVTTPEADLFIAR